jgi:hypothetical protein
MDLPLVFNEKKYVEEKIGKKTNKMLINIYHFNQNGSRGT